MQQNDWEKRYLQGQTGWDRGVSSQNLSYWLESGLLKKGSVLIPGCGNGYEVLTLAKKGFDVTAIDIAETPIKNLQSALKNADLKATLVEADFFAWEPNKEFDAIYEQTSLCALHPDQWQAYAACLFRWLKPSGFLYVQFMQTDDNQGPPYHCEIDVMRELFKGENWLWSEEQFESKNELFKNDNTFEVLYRLEKK